MVDREFKRVQFCSYKIDCVVTPRNDCLAGHGQTESYIVRQCFVTRDEHLHVLRCDRHELSGNDAAFGNACNHSFEAIEIPTEICESNFARQNLVLLENGVDEEIRERTRSTHRDCLASEMLA